VDDFTWFVVGVAGGATATLGALYAAYKLWLRRKA